MARGTNLARKGFDKMSKKSEEEGTFKRTKCIILLDLDHIFALRLKFVLFVRIAASEAVLAYLTKQNRPYSAGEKCFLQVYFKCTFK